MPKIRTGTGFMEANRQMEESTKDAQAARERGDTAAEQKATERFAQARGASAEYVAETYGS